nr:DUF4150 domain-containing protein [Variovorax dokdonensis]
MLRSWQPGRLGDAMPVTVKVNGAANSLVHKGSNHISTATIPDVCKTPSPGGPVPMPYPNISQSATLDKGTTTVKADGGMMIATKGSEFSLSNGDNAGVAGGVKSSTFMKESTWILYSFDVKMDGQNACRLSDKKMQNHENTADLMGAVGPPVTTQGTDDDCIVGTYDEIKDKCPDGHQAHHIVPDYCARTGNRKDGIAGIGRIPNCPSFGDGPSVCLKGHARTTGSAHNVAHQCDAKIAGFGQSSSNGPAGTAPKSEVVPAATQAAQNAVSSEECKKKIKEQVDKSYANVPDNQSMRTTQMPSTGPASTHLSAGGCAPGGGMAV